MKKFFEKHSLGKILGILFIITFILSWIIPAGSFNGTEFVKTDYIRFGLSDISNIIYVTIAMNIDKIIFLLSLAAFYGVLSKIDAYDNVTSKIAKVMKGKEILFTVLISVIIAVLTSFSTSIFAVLIFVPFIIEIIKKMNLDNITAFAVTFGSMMIGALGATYGSEGFTWFNYYILNVTGVNFLEKDMLYRVLILVVGLLLFNFFTVIRVKGLAGSEKLAKDKKVKVETSKRQSSLALIIILSIVALINILGLFDWNTYFEIDIFNKFHDWLTGLTIGKDFKLISYILGSTVAPFGNQGSKYAAFSLYVLSSLLILSGLLLMIIYGSSFDDMIESLKSGIKKYGKMIVAILCAYSICTMAYLSQAIPFINSKLMAVDGKPNINIDYKGSGQAYFNIDKDGDNKADYNKINKDTNKDGKCDLNCDTNKDGYPDKFLDFDGDGEISERDEEIASTFGGTSTINLDVDQNGTPDVNIDTDYNLASNILAATVTSIFNNDMLYTGYELAQYLGAGFGASINIVFLVFLTMFGLLAFILPNSILLVAGLTLLDVDYKDWIKYIWKFVVGMLLCLVLIYVLLILI